MAAVVNGSSSDFALTTDVTIAHTATSGASMVIALIISTGVTTGATWNGNAMTEVASFVNTGYTRITVYAIDSPDTGAQDCVASIGTKQIIGGVVWDISGSDNVASLSTDSDTSDSVTSVSSTPGSGTSDDVVVDLVRIDANNALTVGADQTEDLESGLSGDRVGASHQAGDDGAMTWSWTGSTDAVHAAVLIPGSAAATNPKGPLGMPLHGPFGGPV